MSNTPLYRCIPIDYIVYGGRALLQYIEAPVALPTDAFIYQTEQRQKQARAVRQIVALDNIQESQPFLLAGFLLHSARCGSTLLCHMLDALPDCFVVRESVVLNKLLNDPMLMPNQRSQLLHGVIKAYCRYADYLGRRCVIKFTSHCTLHLPYLLTEFPAVPWIYLYRDPHAIVASLLKKTPRWLSPSFMQQVLKLPAEQVPDSLSQRSVLMLQRYFSQVVKSDALSDLGKFYAYEQLLCEEALGVQGVASHFGFDITDQIIETMVLCLNTDAKIGLPSSQECSADSLVPYEESCFSCKLGYEYLCSNISR